MNKTKSFSKAYVKPRACTYLNFFYLVFHTGFTTSNDLCRNCPSQIWYFQIWLHLCSPSCSFHSRGILLFQFSLSYIVRLKVLHVFYMCLCSLLCTLHVSEFGPISCAVIQFMASKFCEFLMICQSFYVPNIKPLLYIPM